MITQAPSGACWSRPPALLGEMNGIEIGPLQDCLDDSDICRSYLASWQPGLSPNSTRTMACNPAGITTFLKIIVDD